MNPLPVQRASQLECTGPQTQWLVEELWTDQAVGILGGEPKCCKSFLALDVAVSVASGAACLRQFPVRRSGAGAALPGRRLAGGGAPALGGHRICRSGPFFAVASSSHYRPLPAIGYCY